MFIAVWSVDAFAMTGDRVCFIAGAQHRVALPVTFVDAAVIAPSVFVKSHTKRCWTEFSTIQRADPGAVLFPDRPVCR